MIDVYTLSNECGPDAECVWVDLCRPDAEALAQASERVGFPVPDRRQIGEIEFSSRIWKLGDTLFLNVPRYQEGESSSAPLGFALSRTALVTQREYAIDALVAIKDDLTRRPSTGSVDLFLRMIEHMVDRLADRIEQLESEVSERNRQVFDQEHPRATLQQTLFQVGGLGRRLGRLHNSLLGLTRIMAYLHESPPAWFDPETATRVRLVVKDLQSLNEFEEQLGERIEFLLDGVLGLISVNQNEVMRVMAVASVVGIPPTVLVGIWGMNFIHMPELAWGPGYYLALAVVLLSVLLPLWWFRRRGWL